VAEHLVEPAAAGSKHYFLLRRLHSLTGLVPIGAYMVVHLLTNASILAGPEVFQANVDNIHLLAKLRLLTIVEWTFIFIPLIFHGVVGWFILVEAKPNARQYGYGANKRFSLQRITGVIAFAFIGYHVWQMHHLFAGWGGGNFDPHDAAASAAEVIQSGWALPLYAVGVLACVFHLANGIWTSLITWGITVGPRSQRMSGYACTAFGIALALVSVGALAGFRAFDLPPVRHDTKHAAKIEQRPALTAGAAAAANHE